MKFEVSRILLVIQNLFLVNQTLSTSFANNTSLAEKNKNGNLINYSFKYYMDDDDSRKEIFKNTEKERLNRKSILKPSFGKNMNHSLKNKHRRKKDSFLRFIRKRNLLSFTIHENSSSDQEISIVNKHNVTMNNSESSVNNSYISLGTGESNKNIALSILPYKNVYHIFRGVIHFNETESFINKTDTNENQNNHSSRHNSIFQGTVSPISVNNQSNEDWYASLISVTDLRSLLNAASTRDITNNTSQLIDKKLNSTENEIFDILNENFDCVIDETLVLNISCVNVDFYLIGEYLPNDTIILDLSYGNQIKLIKPLFQHLKSLNSLTLSHNHHRYITRAFMGLENLENLDLSNNDIMVILNAFSYIPKLRSLNLSGNEIKRIRSISNAVRFLENLENLTLNHNVHINYIEIEDLYNLKTCNISLFSLFNTTLQFIERGSFNFMPNLKILELSVNYLNEDALANVTCSITRNVEFLYFGQMLRIKEFPIEAIKCLTNAKVKQLRLWFNYISYVPVFPNLPYLQILSLSNCSIKAIAENAFKNVPEIKIIYIRGNKLRSFPSAVSSTKKLQKLFIDSQDTDTFQTFSMYNYAFQNLTYLKEFSISRVHLETLSRYTLNGLNNLNHLYLSQAVLYDIEDYAFETLTSLELLDLRGNGLKFLTNFTFYGLNNLQYLYLFGNFISFMESVYPFQFSLSLFAVLLHYNQIEFLPKDMFLNQENLKILILGRNKVVPWTERILHPKAKVVVLDISQNNVDYISEVMLEEFNQVTEYLDVSKNPFNCSKCGMKQFQEFCLASNLSLTLLTPREDDKVYNCMNPQILQSKNFFEVELPEVVCIDLVNPILSILTIILICTFIILIIGSILVCYTFRWYIRYWIFHVKTNFKRKRSCFKENNYMYDAFIIYSSCDTAWVVKYLVPALENQEPHYKLCIHQRDFQVGRQITENILEAIDSSRKVILILTEGFIKSEWCMYELHLAQHKLFRDTRDILILVKLKTIDKKLYSKNVSYIEKTRRCFMWNDSHIGQKLFWDQIRKQLGQASDLKNFQIESKC